MKLGNTFYCPEGLSIILKLDQFFAYDCTFLFYLNLLFFLGNSIWSELWDKNLLSEPVYYLLIVSQCCNAIGFLNLTNFLNVHIFQTLQLTDEYIAYTLIPMQMFDLLGRILVPLVSDKLQPYCRFIRHWIYILGCIGTGSCMMSLELAKTWNQLLVLCVLMGFFSRYVKYCHLILPIV